MEFSKMCRAACKPLPFDSMSSKFITAMSRKLSHCSAVVLALVSPSNIYVEVQNSNVFVLGGNTFGR